MHVLEKEIQQLQKEIEEIKKLKRADDPELKEKYRELRLLFMSMSFF